MALLLLPRVRRSGLVEHSAGLGLGFKVQDLGFKV